MSDRIDQWPLPCCVRPWVFVGAENETAMVRLRDRQGRERIRLAVDQQGAARLEFLDAAGAVVERLPR